MQNKPNFRKAEMNISSALTKGYENELPLPPPRKQTQSNPISAQKRRFTIVIPSAAEGLPHKLPAHFDDSPKYLTHFIGLLTKKAFFGNLGNLQRRPGTKQTPISPSITIFSIPDFLNLRELT